MAVYVRNLLSFRFILRRIVFSQGTDVTSVTLAGIPATVTSQSAQRVVVVAQPAPTVVTGDVVVKSASKGTVTKAGGFSYVSGTCFNGLALELTWYAGSSIDSVFPFSLPISGGDIVTVSGRNLGSGTDITR